VYKDFVGQSESYFVNRDYTTPGSTKKAFSARQPLLLL
jgi:hypothetical protein